MTRNRVCELDGALRRLGRLPEAPPVIVVDNGSDDGTARHVRTAFPDVRVVRLESNQGVEARNRGVALASTPYVAFCDDDSAWEPGSLARVVGLFDRHPRLGAITAHVRVEPEGHDDAVSLAMQQSPVDDGVPGLPGRPVLGFLACATAVRRQAFLEVGGFERRLHFGGEEAVLATDLVSAGWSVRYVPDVLVRHHVSAVRDPRWRRRRDLRNELWTLWLRRPTGSALHLTGRRLRHTPLSIALPAATEAVVRGGWVLRARRPVPPAVERQLRLLD